MRHFWRRWTYEIPLAIGDALWDVLVVQLAAWLDRLTVRKVIAFIPVVILLVAYYHSIPIPPELMLIGDFLAYIDIFSVVFLIGLFSRMTTVLFFVKQATTSILSRASSVVTRMQRLDRRHRREHNAKTWARRHPDKSEDDRAIAGWRRVALA